MSELVKTLITKRANTWEQAKAHLAAVEADDKRTIIGEGDDAQTWSRLNTELEQLDQRIEEVTGAERRSAAADKLSDEFAGAKAPESSDGKQDSDGEILRKIAMGELKGHEFRMAPGEGERRDLTKGTATDGAELVPTSFRAQLVEHMVAMSAIRRTNVQVLTTNSGEAIQVPKTTSYSAAAIVSEGGAIGESDPQFAQVTLDAFKYAFITEVSSELLQDSAVNLQAFLAKQGGRALALGPDAHFVNGTGSGQPNGVVGAATVGVTGGTGVTGAFTADNLIDLLHSVLEAYRANGSWLMRDATLSAARKLKDTTNQYLWQPGLREGEPNQLLGKPVFSDPNVPAVALSARSVVFGDFSAYMIRDVNSVRIERSDHAKWENDLASFRFIFRTDGDLVDTTGAVKAFVGAGT